MNNFEWIAENVAGPGVDPAELEANFQGCQCLGECSPTSECSCLLDGKPNFDAEGRFLHLANSAAFSAPHLECSSQCECALFPERCTNRRVQHGVQHKLKVLECPGKGFGVFAAEKIAAGHFVVEYVGEVIGREEAERRLASQKADEHNYLFTIREFIRGKCHYTFIDGRQRGNISRFINHSCAPNLQLQLFRLGRQSPSLAMFAARDIEEGEELAYSYGFLQRDDSEKAAGKSDDGTNSSNVAVELSYKECRCGASECLGRLPSASTI